MTDITITGAFGPVTFTANPDRPEAAPEDLDRLDSYLAAAGLQLPDAFRAFLAQTNGAEVSPSGVAYRYTPEDRAILAQVLSEEDEILTQQVADVQNFAGFDEPDEDLIAMQRHVRQWGRPGLFGIAGTTFGDFIVMDLAQGEMHGAIHYLTLQGVAPLGEEGVPVPLGYIAPSFESFQTMFFDIDEVMAEAQQKSLQDFLDSVLGRR
jgi:hypothetical protein